MKASVVIPCFDCESTVADCIASFTAGELRDFEIVAVDDGSTDSTPAVLEKIASSEPRLRIVRIPHSGQSAARNAGIRAAHGDWLAFADADDTVAPGFLSAMTAAAEAARADFAICPFSVRRADGSLETAPLKDCYNLSCGAQIRRRFLPRVAGYPLSAVFARLAGRDVTTRFREPGYVWRCVYSRSIVERYNIRFDESLSMHEDALFVIEFALRARRMVSVDAPLYIYFPGEDGAAATARRNASRGDSPRPGEAFLRALRSLDRRWKGKLRPLYAGSVVFNALLGFREALRRRR